MSGARQRSVLIAAVLVVAAGAAGDAAAQATTDSTTGSMFDSVTEAPVSDTVAIDDTSTAGTSSIPSDITITGESDTSSSSEGLTLEGTYVIDAGGSRQSAILGSITFDAAGTVVSGTISIISAAASSASSTATTSTESVATGGTGSSSSTDSSTGSDVVPVAAAAADATVTDCTATGGTYSLATGGAGEAQIQLDCGGNERTVTWRLFVTATDGFTQAQQFRAVQIEPLSASGNDGIVDLTLTRQ